LYFYDDGTFKFEKRLFTDSCLVDKKDNNVVKAWKHFYSADLRFDGFKNIKADMVSLGFDRDFILDPFNKVPVTDTPNAGGKPKATESDIKKWTAQVAESQRYKVMNKPGNMLIYDKITIFLGVGLILELIALGISIAMR
jgi:hypothetical protein